MVERRVGNLTVVDFARLRGRGKEVCMKILASETVRFVEREDGSATSVIRVVNPPGIPHTEQAFKAEEDHQRHVKLVSSRPSEKSETRSTSPLGKTEVRTSIPDLVTTSSTTFALDALPPSPPPPTKLRKPKKRPNRSSTPHPPLPPTPKSFVFTPELIPVAQQLHLDCSTLRGKLLPTKEVTRIIDEIYLLWRSEGTNDFLSIVLTYFRQKYAGKTVLEQHSGDFFYTVSVGKAATDLEGRIFLNFLSGLWSIPEFSLYNAVISRIEAITHQNLTISKAFIQSFGGIAGVRGFLTCF